MPHRGTIEYLGDPGEVAMRIGKEDPAIVIEPVEEPVPQPVEEPVPVREKPSEPVTSNG
jgi:hypothetical protein